MFSGDAVSVPWWWSRIVFLERRIRAIVDRSAFDPEGMVAPRDIWPLAKKDELEAWYKSREALKKWRTS